MADFERLLKHIIDSNGKPSESDVLDAGYSMENFMRISQQNKNPDKLVRNARNELLARGIHYKE